MDDKKREICRWSLGIVALLLFIGCIGWLLWSFHSPASNSPKMMKADKIHVAIVNEDSGSYYQKNISFRK